MANFETSVVVACSPEKAFDFLSRPANVLKVTPPEVQLTLLEYPDVIEKGSRLKFEIAGYGPVQQFLHEITELEPLARFVEQQLTGPLGSFTHEHIVESSGGGVTVIDRIEFEPPGGLLGFVVTEDRVRESLEASYHYRYQALKSLLE